MRTVGMLVWGVLLAVAGCDRPGDSVAGIDDIQVVPIDYALVRQLSAEKLPTEIRNNNHKPKIAPISSGEYHVGAGDKLFIAIYSAGGKGDRELSRIYPPQGYTTTESDYYEVPQSGTINLPYIGEVRLKDRTAKEIRGEISARFSKFFKNPQIDVKMLEYSARHIVVAGEVLKPGEQKVSSRDLTVLLALEAAGGATPAGDLENTELRHKDGTVETLDLMAMMSRGDTTQNRILAEGDVLYIPTNHRNKVFVMGEVVKPEAQTISKGVLSLTEALSAAGGMDKITASRSHVYVVRGVITEADVDPKKKISGESARKMHVRVYQMDASDPASLVVADQFMLKPRDVVYVSTAPVTEWSRLINQLIPGSVNSILYGALYQ